MRVDTGLGRNENVNVEMKPNTYIILSKTDHCHLEHFSYSCVPLVVYAIMRDRCACPLTDGHVDPGSALTLTER